jgi:phosphate uptake regulator
METRKVQVTGGSTFTVSLPKEWAEENGVSAGSVVELFNRGETLLMKPKTTRESEPGELALPETKIQHVERAVIAMYLNGFTRIRFDVSRLDYRHRKTVKETAYDLIGLEVITESRETIEMQSLLDASELSIPNSVMRMRLLALDMLEDAITGLVENESERLESVVLRDDDLDRLWYLVSRLFRRTLHDPTAVEEVTLGREACFDYRSAARQLERVGDHAVKIAENASEIETVPDEIAADLTSLSAEVRDIIGDAIDALDVEEPATVKHGNRLRNRTDDCEATVREIEAELWDLDPAVAQRLSLIVDSLSRSADYGGNVAEIALQRAMPNPGR